MKDLYTQTVMSEDIGIASIVKEVNGDKYFIYPNSLEPLQLSLSPGQRIIIEILNPNDGPAFIRYYRGDQ